MSALFGSTSISSALASAVVYPLDTLKRRLQVTGSFGYNDNYSEPSMGIVMNKFFNEGLKSMYRGCSLNIVRTITFPFVLYTFKSDKNII